MHGSRVALVAVAALTLGALTAGSAVADGAWIEGLPGSWNAPSAAIPHAPAGDAAQLARCPDLVRAASTAADRGVEAAGWKLFGPVLSSGATSIVRAAASADGMCRPLGYQAFLFVGDAFAGTLAPAPMDSRTDGSLIDLAWLDAASATAKFARYAAADPLCCPRRNRPSSTRSSSATAVPVLTALSAQTAALAAPPPPPPPLWTGSLGAGLSLTSGNTDTSSYNLGFDAVRDPKKLWVFRADGFYLRTDQDGEQTADKTLLHAREERKITDRWFALADIAYLRDRFKDIDYLVAPSVGMGWKAILPEPVSLIFDGGVGYAFEKNPGLDKTSDAAFNLGEALVWNLSKRATLLERVRGLWKFDDTEDAIYHGELTLAAGLTKHSQLKVSYLVDYDNLPTSPELDKTDTALLATVAMKF
jgi:putative salt-induced outer membrane protein YdiY